MNNYNLYDIYFNKNIIIKLKLKLLKNYIYKIIQNINEIKKLCRRKKELK